MSYFDNLRYLRQQRHLTLSDMADLLNTTPQYYQKYEKGLHPLPVAHLMTICRHFNVSADYILGLQTDSSRFPDRITVEMIPSIELEKLRIEFASKEQRLSDQVIALRKLYLEVLDRCADIKKEMEDLKNV